MCGTSSPVFLPRYQRARAPQTTINVAGVLSARGVGFGENSESFTCKLVII